jgi:hypothetical protein
MKRNTIESWATFKTTFEEFFVSADIEEAWWNELENIEQGDMTTNDLQLTLEELFQRLNIAEDKMKRRYLLKSLNPELAYEVEKEATMDYSRTIRFIKKAEMLNNKYQHIKNTKKNLENKNILLTKKENNVTKPKKNLLLTNLQEEDHQEESDQSIRDSLSSLAENFKILQVFLVNQQQQYQQQPHQQQYQQQPQQRQYQQQYPQQQYQQQQYQQQPMTRHFACYNCGENGHMSRHCPNREVYQESGKDSGQ